MRIRLLAAAVLLALLAGAAPALAQGSEPLPDLEVLDPVRFSYEGAIVEHYQVTTRNGIDQMWVDVIRPDTAEPVPAIMMSSPYYNTLGRGWRGELKTPHQGPSFPTSPGVPFLSGTAQTPFPEWYDEYFVPRGYAYVATDLRGTRNSSGCQVYGDRDEVFDTVDVIDFIADQPWSNGKVGMTGGSYDGTIAIGAAAEQPISGRHPDALAAIIPIRAIDRWYDYHFFNGVQSLGHSLTPALFTAALAGGDTQNSGTDDLLLPLHVVERKACIATVGAAVDAGYASPYQDADAPFWSERDFQKDAAGMRAAVFLLHGLFDFNVKTNNMGYLWESLPEGLPQKLWLFNGDHVDPHVPTVEDAEAGGHVMPFPFQAQFIEATHRWYLQFLKGVEAGALDTPQFAVQRADGAFADGGAFPAATRDLSLSLTPDRTLVEGSVAEGTVIYRDAPTGSAPTSVVVTTEPFTEDTRLSGQFGFDLDVSIEGVDTSIAVTILSVPPDVEPTVRSTDTMDGTNAAPLRLGHAWLRAFYRESVPLRGVSTPARGAFMSRNQRTDVQFGSLYTDVVVPAGNRLAFRFSNSEGGTVAANTGGTVTLHTGPDASRILLPIADPPAPAPEPSSSPSPPPTTPPSPPASPPAPPPPATIERASGEDRIGTAVDISQAVRDDADTIVLARADEYADALAGAPLAAQLRAPLLLTGTDRLDSRTAAEIDRLGADQAVLLGGTAALSSSVEDELTRAGLSTRRAAGPNRFATAAEIAAQLPPSDGVFLAEGANADPERGWPDALSASALAARLIRPVLLATRDNLPSESADALSAQDTVTIVGGPDALSEDLAAQVDEVAGTVRRVAGADRYETSVRLADEALAQGLDPAVTWVATGTDWPDGLTAAAAAGASRGLLILVDGSDAEESTPTLDWITAHRDAIRTLRLVGGESAITTDTENQLRTALAG